MLCVGCWGVLPYLECFIEADNVGVLHVGCWGVSPYLMGFIEADDVVVLWCWVLGVGVCDLTLSVS